MVSNCTRIFSRDLVLVKADWQKFFEANPTPWVYLNYIDVDPTKPHTAREAKAYITNVVFTDDGFDFDLNYLDGFTEDDHYRHHISPVFVSLYRDNKPVNAAIQYLEFVPLP